ncbi:MAG: triose-phosphate isomerase [Clostridia bacterium]
MKKNIIANFKMNKTADEVKAFLIELIPAVKSANATVFVCPNFVALKSAEELAKNSPIIIGAQNISEFTSGSHTGEISPEMLSSVGVSTVIIGHSERRKQNKETDAGINKKILNALKNRFKIVFCFGETKIEKERNATEKVLKSQIETALSGLYENELKSIIFAYEPVWAIGTGENASIKQIEVAAGVIKKIIKELFSEKAANECEIVYGGSVSSQNAKKIFQINGISGALVGSASLDVSEFIKIINLA